MLNQVIETGRGLVEYSEAGTGPPVLYFHGTGVTGDVMLTIESSVVDAGFRLIAPNRPGYGQTPPSPKCSLAECADVAAALLDSLGIADANVMGSSGGAAFAASFAFNYPDRTTSLILLCPQLHRWDHRRWLPKTSRWTLPFLRRPLLRTILLKLYRMQLGRMTVAQLLRTEAGDRYPDTAGDLRAEALGTLTLAAMRRGAEFAGFQSDFIVFTNDNVMGSRDSITTPTLVIHDEQDPLAPVDHVEWFLSRCLNCERVSIHAAGHLIWIGPDAEIMHGVRLRFLNKHAKRP